MHGFRNKFQGEGGGGGGPGLAARKQSGQRFFVLNLLYSLQRGVQWFYYRENYTFPRIQRGSNILRGVGPTFSRGGGAPNVNFYRTHITCDFPGGSGPPIPPLDPHMVHVHPRNLVLYVQGTRLCSTRCVNAPVSVNVDNNGRYCSRYC